MLPESARERPMCGTVVSVGPGKRDKDGSRKTPKVMLLQLVPWHTWGLHGTVPGAVPCVFILELSTPVCLLSDVESEVAVWRLNAMYA